MRHFLDSTPSSERWLVRFETGQGSIEQYLGENVETRAGV